MLREEVQRPNLIENCAGDAKDEENEEQHQDLSVGQLVYC
jgi:hypothetical protein